MNTCRFSINEAKVEDLIQHFEACKNDFVPPLQKYVDINDYSNKIKDNAETFEVWSENNLIGLLACYLNDYTSKEGYISNVSILPEYQGQKLALTLLNETKKHAKNKNFKMLKLEVRRENNKARNFYLKNNFVINTEKTTTQSYLLTTVL